VLSLPFPDKFFDASCAIDLLEHLPSDRREQAINEQVRVTRGPVIIACPCREDGVELYEGIANAIYRAHFGVGHERLDEHRREPLPWAAELIRYLHQQHGLEAQVFPNGYLPRWAEMIAFNLVLQRVNRLAAFARLVSRFYNQEIYPYDNREPCYRRIMVFGAAGTLSLPSRTEDEAFALRARQLRRLIEHGYSMLSTVAAHRAGEEASQAREGVQQVATLLGERSGEIAGVIELLNRMAQGSGRLEARMADLARELSRAREDEQRERSARQQVEDAAAVLKATVETRDREIKGLQAGLEAGGRDLAMLRAALEKLRDHIGLVEQSERWRIGGMIVALYHRLRFRKPRRDSIQRVRELIETALGAAPLARAGRAAGASAQRDSAELLGLPAELARCERGLAEACAEALLNLLEAAGLVRPARRGAGRW
jgi:hypothetical protein